MLERCTGFGEQLDDVLVARTPKDSQELRRRGLNGCWAVLVVAILRIFKGVVEAENEKSYLVTTKEGDYL